MTEKMDSGLNLPAGLPLGRQVGRSGMIEMRSPSVPREYLAYTLIGVIILIFIMKYLYWVFGIVVVAGVGYLGYQYGTGNISFETSKCRGQKCSDVEPVNTDTTGMQDVLKNATYPTPLTWPSNAVPVGNYSLNNTIIDSFTNTLTGGTTSPITWKTYTNAGGLKFSIQYPSDYTVTDKLPQQGETPVNSGPNQNLSFKKLSDPLQPEFYLWVNPDGFGPSSPDVSFGFRVGTTGTTILERTVVAPNEDNSTDGIHWFTASNWDDAGVLTSGDKGFMVHFRYNEGGANLESTFRKILGSLKNL